MPDDPNSPDEPQRDINGNPVPPPSQSPFGAPPPRPLPGNTPPPPSFGTPAAGGQPGAQQYGQPAEQKYDLAGNPLPSAGSPPAGGPPPGQSPYGTPSGQAPAWPPPPGGAYGQAPMGAYGQAAPFGQPGMYPVQVKGSQILTMGILSFVCFGIILGPVAFVQGTKALAAIDRGEADPTQRGQVSAGRICGLIGGILSLILLIVRFGAIGAALSHGGH